MRCDNINAILLSIYKITESLADKGQFFKLFFEEFQVLFRKVVTYSFSLEIQRLRVAIEYLYSNIVVFSVQWTWIIYKTFGQGRIVFLPWYPLIMFVTHFSCSFLSAAGAGRQSGFYQRYFGFCLSYRLTIKYSLRPLIEASNLNLI